MEPRIWRLVFVSLALSANVCQSMYRPSGENSDASADVDGAPCTARTDPEKDREESRDSSGSGEDTAQRISGILGSATDLLGDFVDRTLDLSYSAKREEPPATVENRDAAAVEGRKAKGKKKMLMNLLVGMKVLGFGLVLPAIAAMTIITAWKGITISLLAFMIASIVGLKNLVSKSVEESKHHHPTTIVVTKIPVPPVLSSGSDWYRSDTDFPYKSHFK